MAIVLKYDVYGLKIMVLSVLIPFATNLWRNSFFWLVPIQNYVILNQILWALGRTPLTGNRVIARPLPAQINTTQNIIRSQYLNVKLSSMGCYLTWNDVTSVGRYFGPESSRCELCEWCTSIYSTGTKGSVLVKPSLIIRQEPSWVRVFENRVWGRISGPKREEGGENWIRSSANCAVHTIV